MTSIGSISGVAPLAQTATQEARPGVAPQAVEDQTEVETGSDASNTGSSTMGNTKNADEADSKKADSAAALEKQIAQLQKQLTQAREQLQSIRNSNMDEQQKGAMTAALQVQVAMLNSSLMSLMMKLAEAIANENGQKFAQTSAASAAAQED